MIKRFFSPAEDQTSLTQKSFLNAVVSLLEYGMQIGVKLIITPILVSGLGNSLFGIWQILQRMVGFLTFADGRPTQALKWLVANRQENADQELKRREVGSTLMIWLYFLPLLLLGGGVFIWLSPRITNAGLELSSTIRSTAAVLMFTLVISGLSGIPGAVLRGSNLGYKRAWLVILLRILEGLLMAASIYFGIGLVGLAAARLIVIILGGILIWQITRKAVVWFGFSQPVEAEVRRFFGLNIWYLIWTLVGNGLLAVDVFLLGYMLSPEVVSVYTLTSYTSQFITGVTLVIIGALMPSIGGIIGRGNHSDVLDLRSEMGRYIWWLVTTIGAAILFWNRSFVHLWVGGENFAGNLVNIFIVLLMIQWVYIENDSRIVDLTLKIEKKVFLGILSLGLSSFLAVILIPKYGMLGLCLGLLIGRLLLTISYPILLQNLLGSPDINLGRKEFLRGITTAVLFVFSAWLGSQMLILNWLTLLLLVVLSGLCLLVALFFLGFNKQQQQQLVKRFQAVYALSLNGRN